MNDMDIVEELNEWLHVNRQFSDEPKLPRHNEMIAKARDEIEGLRAFKRSVDEAINSGDGA